MTAFFNGKNIKNVIVSGNGESIYFISDEENKNILIGMNRIISSNMNIMFKENQVHDIRFYTNPDGKIVPPHELKEPEKKLEGFAWRIKERPSHPEIIIAPSEIERKRKEIEEIIAEEQKEKEIQEAAMEESIRNSEENEKSPEQ